MSEKTGFKLEIDYNVLNHLGIGLYSSTPAVITEMLANAWDAEATLVRVTVDADNDQIILDDNGHGMTAADVQNKFLKVGYARRDAEGSKLSKNGLRTVMGRKGIGKLAMFSLANEIDIYTREESGELLSGRVVVSELQESIKAGVQYKLDKIESPEDFDHVSGTKIVLRKLANKINKTEAYLRPRLARRFSIIGDINNFRVELNGKEVTKEDRGFYADIQFLWYFDKATKAELAGLKVKPVELPKTGVICEELVDNVIDYADPEMKVTGFIATVDKPSKLQKQDEDINEISVFANGRVFQEDLLSELGNSRVFNNYIVGEIHAEFLDRDDIDRATANREAIKKDDPKYQKLAGHIKKLLGDIQSRWDDWRRDLGYGNNPDANPDIQAWIEGLEDKRDRKLANRLMLNIATSRFSNNDIEDAAQKKMLYKSTIVGFEKLRAKSSLEKLEAVTDVLSPEFQQIFASVDDLEQTYYHDITENRLGIIKKLEEIHDASELEKVAQKYLFDHLWLLDPTWGRVSGSEEMEKTLTKELKKFDPNSDKGARLDIAYRTASGRHAIIELKRPGLTSLKGMELLDQGVKYRNAMTQYLQEHPDLGGLNGRVPPIDVFFVLEKDVIGADDTLSKMLTAMNGRVLTYKGLIDNARASYKEYLDIHAKTSKIDELIRKL